MRIVDTNSPVKADRTDAPRATPPAGSDGSNSTKVSPGSDSVQLSGLSGRVSETLQADSAARAQKVGEVAAAVQSGNYHLDAKAVSKAIVDHAIASGADVDHDGDSR